MSNMSLKDLLLARISPSPKTEIAQAPGTVVLELDPHRRYTEPNVRPQGTLLRGAFVYTERYALVRTESGAHQPCSIHSTTFQPNDPKHQPLEIYRNYQQEGMPATDLEAGKAAIAQFRSDYLGTAATEQAHSVEVAQNQARISV